MITIYTTNSCSSCKKAVKWFNDHNIKFKEINMFSTPIDRSDIVRMLQNSENGFEDIISTRSKIIMSGNVDIEAMTYNELADFIIKNPSILRRPIIVDDKRFQVGYDDDEITAFKPRELRQMFSCDSCGENDAECGYVKSIGDIK